MCGTSAVSIVYVQLQEMSLCQSERAGRESSERAEENRERAKGEGEPEDLTRKDEY